MHPLKNAALGLLFLLPALLCAQKPDEKIRKWFEKHEMEKVVKLAARTENLRDTSLALAGLAANELGRDSVALIFFNRALRQNPDYANVWYYRSFIHRNHDRPALALADIRRALALNAWDADFWIQLGDVQDRGAQPDSALVAYRRAITLPNCRPVVYFRMGNVLNRQDRPAEALLAYDTARQRLDRNSEVFQLCLYNIGLLEYLAGNYGPAQSTLEELLDINPKEYDAVAKLIQVHYAAGNYAQADRLKALLYDAHKKGELPERMQDDFCFDQFLWNNRKIAVYERFNQSGALYYKHVFYLFDAAGKTELTVQTESSIATRMGGNQYTMGMDKGKKHYTYIQYSFPEDPDYAALKTAVIEILDGKAKPSSSSGRN